MSPERQIVAIGGGGTGGVAGDALDTFVLGLTGSPRPRVLFVPTGWRDDPAAVAQVLDVLAPRADVSQLSLLAGGVPDLRDLVLGHDLVWVGGGDTGELLARWREHGLDRVLREAWEAGVVLAGSSAGALCWFEDGVTRVSETELSPLGDGLAFLPGSFCAHFGEPDRRAAYPRLVGEGLAPGWAAEDRVGLRFVGTDLRESVSARPGGSAYRVERRGGAVVPEPWPTRFLGRGEPPAGRIPG